MAWPATDPDDVALLEEIRTIPKVELHQHITGSIPVDLTWRLMTEHKLAPVETIEEMERLLVLQEEETGSLLSYLDKFHYPHWVSQFYENLAEVTFRIAQEAHARGVKVLELRSAPVKHTYAGMSIRQAIVAVLEGLNRANTELGMATGLVVIGMRQMGPHIAKILARQAIAESQHLHERTGVIGFDIAGAERGNPPGLFREAFDIARKGGLGLTAHAGEDEGPEMVWQAIDELGCTRIGHGCAALADEELVRRLAKDKILVECCITSNDQTGAVERGSARTHPIHRFLEAGVPVAICTDNVTVSGTDQLRENLYLAKDERYSLDDLARIHRGAAGHAFTDQAADALE